VTLTVGLDGIVIPEGVPVLLLIQKTGKILIMCYIILLGHISLLVLRSFVDQKIGVKTYDY
jgi:hypothetical protein